MINSNFLFSNHCAGCGKLIKTPAISRSGDLPVVYCNSVCETLAKDKARQYKREANSDHIPPQRKTIVFPTQDENQEVGDFIHQYGSNPGGFKNA